MAKTFRIVVTGANGFIGANLVDKILKMFPHELGLTQSEYISPKHWNGEAEPPATLHVVGVDLPGTETRPQAGRFHASARYTYMTLHDFLDAFSKWDEPPVAVFHNGACSSTTETDPEIFRTLNVESSQKIWTLCAEKRVPLFYASSAAVYGDGSKGFSDDTHANGLYTPLNLYGKSKHDFDIWALTQKVAPPVWVGLRYFNVFGPFEGHKGGQASMIWHGYQQILKEGEVRLFESNDKAHYGDGEQVRDFIYVDDIVEISLKLFTLWQSEQWPKTVPHGLFLNLGRGETCTWNRFLSAVFGALRIPPRLTYVPMPEKLSKQYQNHTCADLKNLRSLLPTHRFRTIEEGVTRYVQKFLARGL